MEILGKFLEWIGVKNQLRKDLSIIVLFIVTIVSSMEDKLGAGGGAEKRLRALDEVFKSLRAEGGIDLPSWATGSMATTLFGYLIDWVCSLAKGEKKGNS